MSGKSKPGSKGPGGKPDKGIIDMMVEGSGVKGGKGPGSAQK